MTNLGNLQDKSLKIAKRIKVLNLLLVSAGIDSKTKIEKKIRVLRLIEANSQPESPKNNYSVQKIHLERIKTDTKLFQQRKQEYSERSVNNIINAVKNGTFYWENFDAITLWLNNNQYYILSGHSRYEAFKRLYNAGNSEFSHIPAKIFTGTLEEAQKQIAKKSNTFASKESPLERAKYYQDLRAEGVPEKEIIEEAKINEDKNYTYIIALSHLAPEGILVHDLELFQTEDNENAEILKKIAFWVGYVRSVLPLSDKHEAELYNYLLKHDRHKKYNKSSFYAEIAKAWQQRELFNTPYTAPLNLENLVSKSQTELNYEENVKEAKKKLKEAIEAKEEKTKELINSIRYRENRNPTDAEIKTIQQILQQNGYDASIIKAERELLRLEAQKSFVKQQAKGEMSLFGFLVEDEYYFDFIPHANTEIYEDANNFDELYNKVNSYVNSLKNQFVTNQQTGFDIYFNDNGIGKFVGEKIGEKKLKALSTIKDIIKVAVWVRKEEDKQERSNVEYHYFVSVVQIDGFIHPFLFNVRAILKNNGFKKFIYNGFVKMKPIESIKPS
ncbi:MAG: hypothetical protein Fur0027_22960 [Raineya sp.]